MIKEFEIYFFYLFQMILDGKTTKRKSVDLDEI
jgi:hypothetical protein